MNHTNVYIRINKDLFKRNYINYSLLLLFSRLSCLNHTILQNKSTLLSRVFPQQIEYQPAKPKKKMPKREKMFLNLILFLSFCNLCSSLHSINFYFNIIASLPSLKRNLIGKKIYTATRYLLEKLLHAVNLIILYIPTV